MTDEIDFTWFNVLFVDQLCAVAVLSHHGRIVTCWNDNNIVEIGTIESGIAAAQWAPDQSCLLIVTNNDTILCMSAQFDVLSEIPIPERSPDSPCWLSWRGDCESFAMLSVDKTDEHTTTSNAFGNAIIRFYNKDLILTATCSNVAADAAGSIMRGLGRVTAFAPNGSQIAVPQQRTKNKIQISLLEKNGLRHGDFDLQLPSVPEDFNPWEVVNLAWDITSTVLAVGCCATSKSDIQNGGTLGCVQIYSRSNYHWYLKQQWTGKDMRLLSFDSEISNRFYLTEKCTIGVLLRVVEFQWDVCVSSTSDCTAVVVDGTKLMLTDLGRAIVPPPMSTTSEFNLSDDPQSLNPFACSTSCSFWVRPDLLSWGLAVLCVDGRRVGVSIYLGGINLKSDRIHKFFVDLTQLLPEKMRNSFYTFKSVLSLPEKEGRLTLAFPCSECSIIKSQSEESPVSDNLVVLSIQLNNEKQDTQYTLLDIRTIDVSGIIYSLGTIPNDNKRIIVGIANASSSNSSFSIMLVDLTSPEPHRELLTLPELCPKLLVVPQPSDCDSENDHRSFDTFIVIALSNKFKLFCDETVLMAGVSSLAFNLSYGMLMFTTLGTRPHLHFCSQAQLAHLAANALSSAEDENQLQKLGLGSGFSGMLWESRPVERGAVLVASVPGNAKVIIQLPRGNLESFEPRPLILMQATSLIVDKKAFLECLILLRRQRVDLNFLVDCNPDLFLHNLPSFLVEVLRASKSDLISLLVSSLEDFDVSLVKYPIKRRIDGHAAIFSEKGKVNAICEALRKELLPKLQTDSSSSIINPILCTFAKQRPPLLVEALRCIKEYATTTEQQSNVKTINDNNIDNNNKNICDGDNSSNANSAENFNFPEPNLKVAKVSVPKMQAAIKYLAFLADGSQLFEAALSVCDFHMCRIIARQCQMDPKAYMPLLERFESIGKGFAEESTCPQYCLMYATVHLHLKKHRTAIDWGLNLLRSIRTSNDSDFDERFVNIWNQILAESVEKNGLHEYLSPALTTIEIQYLCQGDTNLRLMEYFKNISSEFRKCCGRKFSSEGKFGEAAAAFLAVDPPAVADAISAAKSSGDWQWALSIAGRFSLPGSGISPLRVAQEIVSEFREQLEQAEAAENVFSTSNSSSPAVSERALEAARICLDYCGDVEGAVSILLSARCWCRAQQLAARVSRTDLLDEILAAAREACAKVQLILVSCRADASKAATKLETLWKDPSERLKQVALADLDLQNLLDPQGDESADRGKEGPRGDWADTASEYSAFSAKSERSERSVGSGLSSASVLSTSSKSSSISAASKTSSFSIQGLDHTLLSRGSASDKPFNGKEKPGYREKKEKDNPRRQKRKEKSRIKTAGSGRDECGLRAEANHCESILSAISAADSAVSETSELLPLLLLGYGNGGGISSGKDSGIEDRIRAIYLQKNVRDYMTFLKGLEIGVAPAYPTVWLEKKAMEAVRSFQNESPESHPAASDSTARGIKSWKQRLEELDLKWKNANKAILLCSQE